MYFPIIFYNFIYSYKLVHIIFVILLTLVYFYVHAPAVLLVSTAVLDFLGSPAVLLVLCSWALCSKALLLCSWALLLCS